MLKGGSGNLSFGRKRLMPGNLSRAACRSWSVKGSPQQTFQSGTRRFLDTALANTLTPLFGKKEAAALVDSFDKKAVEQREAGFVAPEMDVNIVFDARSRIKAQKAAGGGEVCVPDILKKAPYLLVLVLCQLFAQRYKGCREDIPSWQLIVMFLCFPDLKLHTLSLLYC